MANATSLYSAEFGVRAPQIVYRTRLNEYSSYRQIALQKRTCTCSPSISREALICYVETKNRWARDDPAFVVIQSALLFGIGV